ncbi:MAG: hypothetical protein ACI85O_000589 [Saprospiraceae bacterium]
MLQKISTFLYRIPLLAFVPILAILAWFSSPGIFLGDEYIYAENSVNIAHGTFTNSGHHFDNRFGLLLPCALFVNIFGTHYSVFFIVPFLSFVFLLGSLHQIISKENRPVAFLVFLLLAFNPAFLRLSADVAVDLVMTAFMTFAVFFTYHIRQRRFSEVSGGFGVAFTLFYAVFTKMTAIYCFPFFAFLLISDLSKKQFSTFWSSLIAFSVLFYTLYFGAYYYLTGDAFFRFNGFEVTHGSGDVVPWNYRNRPLKDLIERITIYPIAFFMFAPGFSLPIILGVFSICVGKWWKKTGLVQYTTFYFIFITLAFWFGSSSLKQYNPVILVERMLLPLLPPATILVALLWTNKEKIKRPKKFILLRNLMCGALILFCIVLFISRPDKGLGLAYSIFLLLLLVFTQNKEVHFSRLLKAAFFLPFILQIVYRIFFVVPDIPFFAERKFIQQIEQRQEKTLILTDTRMAEMQAIFFDFNPPDYTTILDRNFPIKEKYKNYFLHENKNNLLNLSISSGRSLEEETKFTILDTLTNGEDYFFYSILPPKIEQ